MVNFTSSDNMICALELMNYIAEKYNIPFDSENKYYSIISGIQEKFNNESSVIDEDDAAFFKKYILSLDIPELQSNIDSYFGDSILDNHHTIDELSNSALLLYLCDVLRAVTFTQKDNLVCGKYSVCIWNTGFHNLAKSCRGKVVDMDTMEIVSHPFDKFFNLNEVPETNEKLVKNEIDNSTYVYATEKKDGSTIIASKYKGDILITTNGSFDNDQTAWAKELFKTKYKDFKDNIENGYTYIFELIHPDNRIVIDYGDEKALYLLAIRDLSKNKLLPLDDVHRCAEKNNFPTPDVYDFNNLDEMVNLAHTLKNANQEGWVLRIGNENHESMFKLKLDEYFEMHKCYGKITTPWVYKHTFIFNDIDDFIAISSAEQKASIYAEIDKIKDIQNIVKATAVGRANNILENINISREEFLKDNKLVGTTIQNLFKNKDEYTPFVISALKTPEKLDSNISLMPVSKFKVFMEINKEKEEITK